jgi:hypothetical protein
MGREDQKVFHATPFIPSLLFPQKHSPSLSALPFFFFALQGLPLQDALAMAGEQKNWLSQLL